MKFYYIVKGATQGDNVYEHDSEDEESALTELERIYGADMHGLTIELLTESQYETEKKRILDSKMIQER